MSSKRILVLLVRIFLTTVPAKRTVDVWKDKTKFIKDKKQDKQPSHLYTARLSASNCAWSISFTLDEDVVEVVIPAVVAPTPPLLLLLLLLLLLVVVAVDDALFSCIFYCFFSSSLNQWERVLYPVLLQRKFNNNKVRRSNGWRGENVVYVYIAIILILQECFYYSILLHLVGFSRKKDPYTTHLDYVQLFCSLVFFSSLDLLSVSLTYETCPLTPIFRSLI